MVKSLDSSNFDSAISNGVAVVDFYADWCGPCKMMAPIMENIAKELPSMNICKLNIDVANDVAARYKVMSIPTFMIFKDGIVVETFKGAMPKEIMESKLKNHL